MTRVSYIARHPARQALALALIAALPLGGCAALGFSLDEDPVAVTGATGEAENIASAGGLAAGDLIAIGSAIARIPEPAGTADVAWDNPDSGSAGRITRLVSIDGVPSCRAFRTTVNVVAGVRALSGVACRDVSGGWSVEGMALAEDG